MPGSAAGICLAAALLAPLLAEEGAPAAPLLMVREVAVSGRIDLVPGNAATPRAVADESSRRCVLTLAAGGPLPVLGWEGGRIEACVSGTGETLAAVMADAGVTAQHLAPAAAGTSVATVSLPVAERSFRSLERLRLRLRLLTGRGEPESWAVPLTQLDGGAVLPVPGLTGAAVVLADRKPGQVILRLDGPAAYAVADLRVKRGAKDVPVRGLRFEQRDGITRLIAQTTLQGDDHLDLRLYRTIERVEVPLDAALLDLGQEVPGRDRLAPPGANGAEGF